MIKFLLIITLLFSTAISQVTITNCMTMTAGQANTCDVCDDGYLLASDQMSCIDCSTASCSAGQICNLNSAGTAAECTACSGPCSSTQVCGLDSTDIKMVACINCSCQATENCSLGGDMKTAVCTAKTCTDTMNDISECTSCDDAAPTVCTGCTPTTHVVSSDGSSCMACGSTCTGSQVCALDSSNMAVCQAPDCTTTTANMCATCDSTDNMKCATCNTGYTLNGDKSACKKCTGCTDTQTCVADGTTANVKCEDAAPSMTDAERKDAKPPEKNATCPDLANCMECTDKAKCTKCHPGYKKESDKCENCDTNFAMNGNKACVMCKTAKACDTGKVCTITSEGKQECGDSPSTGGMLLSAFIIVTAIVLA